MNLVCPFCKKPPIHYEEGVPTWYKCPCKAFGCAIIDDALRGYHVSGEPYLLRSWWENQKTCLYKRGTLGPILSLPYIQIHSQEELNNLLPRLLKLKAFS